MTLGLRSLARKTSGRCAIETCCSILTSGFGLPMIRPTTGFHLGSVVAECQGQDSAPAKLSEWMPELQCGCAIGSNTPMEFGIFRPSSTPNLQLLTGLRENCQVPANTCKAAKSWAGIMG